MRKVESTGWKRASIYDVAREAGVSHMTVSRVLNEHPNIRESTRKRVLEAIETTNYFPSSIARSLATQRGMRIGVFVDSPIQYGPNSTLRALESAARMHGYMVSSVSFSGQDDSEDVERALVELLAQDIDGICVIAPRLSSLDLMQRKAPGLPAVVVQPEPAENLHTVSVDQAAGAREIVQHLIDLGHQKIMHLAGPLDWHDSHVRAAAYVNTLREEGLEAQEPIIGDWSSDCGFDLGKNHNFDAITAIFASNDQMALGLIHGLTSRGLRVPQDLSVVGFDDLPDARHFLPPLTTVRQKFSDLGVRIIELLVDVIKNPDKEFAHEVIQPRLMVRESSAAPRE